jgi:hypothetical protein
MSPPEKPTAARLRDVGRAFRIGSCAAATISLFTSCDRPDDTHTVTNQVLSCIADGGGTLGEGADVAIEGGKAMAVVGPVEATDALINECLDLANRKAVPPNAG